jgi:hypothetical protein
MSALRIGSVAYDKAYDRVGVVMALVDGEVFLRPVGGGCEWTAQLDQLRPATRAEELSAKNAAVNRRSRSEVATSLSAGAFAEPCTRPCQVCQSAGRQ